METKSRAIWEGHGASFTETKSIEIDSKRFRTILKKKDILGYHPASFLETKSRHKSLERFFFDSFQTKEALTTDLKLESTERSCEASPEISLKLETVADVGEF